MNNMQLNQSLSRIAKWGKFLGYLFIVSGAISALSGLFALVVGAIPGVICIFLGLYILRSAKEAEKLQYQMDEQTLCGLLDNYAKFLQLQGIYMLVIVILAVLVALFLTVAGYALLDSLFYGMY